MQRQAQLQESINKQQSKVLMKNMIRISISSICYHRDIFPSKCFSFKPYGSMKIIQLDAADMDEQGEISVRDGKAFLLTQWLERGVFVALDDEYIHSLSFAIFTKHPKTDEDLLLESYEFKISYGDTNHAEINGVPLASKEDVKAQAGKFIRNLVSFSQSLDELPHNNWITIQLQYMDSVPENYEPEYFKTSDHSILALDKLGSSCLKIKLGGIDAKHMKIQARFTGLESLLHEDLANVSVSINKEHTTQPFGESYNSPCILQAEKHICDQSQPKTISSSDLAEKIESLAILQQNVPQCIQAQTIVTPATLKEYVSMNKKSTVRECCTKLRINVETCKTILNKLVQDGDLRSKGRWYEEVGNQEIKKCEPMAAFESPVINARRPTSPPAVARKLAPNPIYTNQLVQETPQAKMNIVVDERRDEDETAMSQFSEATDQSRKRKFGIIKDPILIERFWKDVEHS